MINTRVHFVVIGCLFSILVLFGSSFSVLATLPNHPPNPPIIEGETNGLISLYYNYTFTLTDPDDDILLNLEIDWGDGTESVDCGCGKTWHNGTIVVVSHSFDRQGDYGVIARIQDEYGIWSNWSDPYVVSMPKKISRFQYNSWLFNEVFSLSDLFEIILFLRDFTV